MAAYELIDRESADPTTPFRHSVDRHRRQSWLSRLGEAVVSVIERIVTWEPADYRADFGRAYV